MKLKGKFEPSRFSVVIDGLFDFSSMIGDVLFGFIFFVLAALVVIFVELSFLRIVCDDCFFFEWVIVGSVLIFFAAELVAVGAGENGRFMAGGDGGRRFNSVVVCSFSCFSSSSLSEVSFDLVGRLFDCLIFYKSMMNHRYSVRFIQSTHSACSENFFTKLGIWIAKRVTISASISFLLSKRTSFDIRVKIKIVINSMFLGFIFCIEKNIDGLKRTEKKIDD